MENGAKKSRMVESVLYSCAESFSSVGGTNPKKLFNVILQNCWRADVLPSSLFLSNLKEFWRVLKELMTVNIKNPSTDGKFKLSFYFTKMSVALKTYT